MTLRPYKFIVTPVVQRLDDKGEVVGEVTVSGTEDGQPMTVYGCDALAKWAREFPEQLKSNAPEQS